MTFLPHRLELDNISSASPNVQAFSGLISSIPLFAWITLSLELHFLSLSCGCTTLMVSTPSLADIITTIPLSVSCYSILHPNSCPCLLIAVIPKCLDTVIYLLPFSLVLKKKQNKKKLVSFLKLREFFSAYILNSSLALTFPQGPSSKAPAL